MLSFKLFDITVSRQTFAIEIGTLWVGDWIGSALMFEYIDGDMDFDVLYLRSLLDRE